MESFIYIVLPLICHSYRISIDEYRVGTEGARQTVGKAASNRAAVFAPIANEYSSHGKT
jgi:hypothetical protein